MPRKQSQGPPPITEKSFTTVEITRGIEKVKRRIAEVEALDPQLIAYDDAQVETAQHNIRDTVREIFGAQSQEALDYRYPRIYVSDNRMVPHRQRVNHQGNFSKGIAQMVTSLNGLITRLEEKLLDISVDAGAEAEPIRVAVATQHESKPTDPTKVFVVHGRNAKARDALFTFLRTIGLKPIEWSEAIRSTGNPAPYVGEILDAAFSMAQAVVVLMTPDDMAYLRELLRGDNELPYELQPTAQARANVLFEAGMALGRHPRRTVLVELGELRPFSDVAGRHAVRINNSTQRRHDLADRLALAECLVDLNGRDWHTAGDFDGALEGL